jgi:UDP-N-acetylglucosamine 1-carboxyvinyltransferase
MDRILIEGGYPLKGTVRVSGAKNAALPAIAACLLTGGWHRIRRVPKLKDVETIKKIMSKMGVFFVKRGGCVVRQLESMTCSVAPYDLVWTARRPSFSLVAGAAGRGVSCRDAIGAGLTIEGSFSAMGVGCS